MLPPKYPAAHERPLRCKEVANIFLSYTRPDLRKARKVARLLWQAGIRVAMYNPRDPWDDPMERMYSIAAGVTCVIWFANDRQPTDWILPELERAASRKIPILKIDSVADLSEVISALRRGDFSQDKSSSFLLSDLETANGTAESEWILTERLFHRQLAKGEESDFIGRLNWFARLESETNAANFAIGAALFIGPPVLTVLLLITAGLVSFFSGAFALTLLLAALILLLATPMLWKLASRFSKPVTWRDHV